MIIKVLTQPIDAATFAAAVKDYPIPVPGLLMKGALIFKAQVEKAGLGIARATLKKKHFDIQLDAMELLVRQEKFIEGCYLSVSSVNYPQILSVLLSEVKKSLAEKADMRPVLVILELLGQDADVIVHNTLRTVGDERLEQILKTLLSAYNDRLCDVINEQIAKNVTGIRITGIAIL